MEVCREARTTLGGNGITLEYSPLRHANNLESVRAYEETDEVHTLVVGQIPAGFGPQYFSPFCGVQIHSSSQTEGLAADAETLSSAPESKAKW